MVARLSRAAAVAAADAVGGLSRRVEDVQHRRRIRRWNGGAQITRDRQQALDRRVRSVWLVVLIGLLTRFLQQLGDLLEQLAIATPLGMARTDISNELHGSAWRNRFRIRISLRVGVSTHGELARWCHFGRRWWPLLGPQRILQCLPVEAHLLLHPRMQRVRVGAQAIVVAMEAQRLIMLAHANTIPARGRRFVQRLEFQLIVFVLFLLVVTSVATWAIPLLGPHLTCQLAKAIVRLATFVLHIQSHLRVVVRTLGSSEGRQVGVAQVERRRG